MRTMGIGGQSDGNNSVLVDFEGNAAEAVECEAGEGQATSLIIRVCE